MGVVEGDGVASAVGGDLALRGVAGAGDVVGAGRRDDRAHRHLVLGQRPRLVRADGGDGTQRLDGVQPPRDGVAARHVLHADCQRDRHDRRQSLGDHRDGEADRGHEQLTPVRAMDDPAEDDQQDGDSQHDRGEHLPEPVHLLGQRSREGLDVRHHRVDLADLRVHARGDDDAPAGPAGHQGAREGHGRPVADAGVGVDRVDRLLRRHGLTRERRFLDPEVGGRQQADVSGNPIPRAKPHHIPGHEFIRGSVPPVPVPADRRRRGEHRPCPPG